MNASRRLRTLEESLSPTEAVLRWLAEARAFGGFQAYAVAALEAPEGAAPLERIIARVESAARREGRGSRATLAAAIAGALEDALFRYELILQLNAETVELSERLRPRLRTLASALCEPAADAPVGQVEAIQARTTPTGVDGRSRVGQQELDELVAIMAIEDEARALLEHHYLDGAEVLFADVAQGWRTLGAEVHHVSPSEAPAKASGGPEPRLRRRGTRSGSSISLARAAQERAAAIAADARLAALTTLGEQGRATELLRARVGAGGEGNDPRLAVRALERLSRPFRGRAVDEGPETGNSAAHPLDGLSAADQARQLRLLADELDGGAQP